MKLLMESSAGNLVYDETAHSSSRHCWRAAQTHSTKESGNADKTPSEEHDAGPDPGRAKATPEGEEEPAIPRREVDTM